MLINIVMFCNAWNLLNDATGPPYSVALSMKIFCVIYLKIGETAY